MVNKFYPPDIGGVETVAEQYARAALAEGHDVRVLACHSNTSAPTATRIQDGVRVTRCRTLGTAWSMPLAPSFPYRFWQMASQVDLVHLHEPFPLGTLAALLRRTPARLVITWHSDVVRQRLAKPLLEPLQRRLCRRAAVVTTTSEALANRSNVVSTVRNKVSVIPLSIPTRIAVDHPRLVEGRYFLYLGRLARYKGLGTLAAAIPHADFGSMRLVVAGSGTERTWLKDQLALYSKDVLLIDRQLSESEKHALLRDCEFLVFPSSEENEAFGIVQLEAMVHGKPVINTNLLTGVPWVSLDRITGLTVPPKDPIALASAITLLGRDSVLRTRLGTGALARVLELFSDDVVLPKILELYRRLTPKT